MVPNRKGVGIVRGFWKNHQNLIILGWNKMGEFAFLDF